MSDQVKIVAAEDAPSNTDGGEAVSTAQATSETPEATTAESESQTAPVAEKAESGEEPVAEEPVANEPVAEEPVAEEPVAEEPVAEEPLANEPTAEVVDGGKAIDSVDAPASEAETSETVASEAEASEADTSEVEANDADTSSETDSSTGNVRILAVGQQVEGTVKRIADFGAFVDIGVGRDGLIHISELSVRRVGKVTDVIAEGQPVTAWIKKLDRDRNRISLTLIDPNTKTIRDLNKDDLVQGTVTRILPYGAFIDIGIGRDALLHVREMGVGYVAKPEDVVKVGDSLEARIIELSRRRGRVDLSLKGLREEPEATPAPQQPDYSIYNQAPQSQSNSRRRQEQAPEPEPEVQDDFEDLEVLSPMELAFKRAMEAEGMELNLSRKKQNKRKGRDRTSLQDEIISRTLTSGRK